MKNLQRTSLQFSLLLCCIPPAFADAPIPGLSSLTESDIRAGAIAFVNMATTPGFEGATVTIDTDDRQSDQLRSSLGFNAEFTLRDTVINGYWGAALVGGVLDDQLEYTADNGSPVTIDLNRRIVGLRGSLGLVFPVNRHFRLRPYLTLSLSEMNSEALFDGLAAASPSIGTNTVFATTRAEIFSTAGSLEALYSRWYGDGRLDISGQYNLIYTDSFSTDSNILDTDARNETAIFKLKYSGATGLVTSGRPWRWKVYTTYTDFITQEKASLGYTALLEFGVAMDWQVNIKPLDWFGWQSIGLRAGYITSADVTGYNIGLTAE